jgi:hypothetical protein
MLRLFTILETAIALALFSLGLYMLTEGFSNKSRYADEYLTGGAVFVSLGSLTLYFAIKSILRRRAMLRYATGRDGAGKATHCDR